MSIPKIDITAPDEAHAVAPVRRDPNLTMPGPDQWPAGVFACLKCETIYDRVAGLRQRASFLMGSGPEPATMTMERSVEAASEVGRFMYGPWHKEGGAASLAAGGEAKPERRGWVPCAAGDDIRGAYLRCDGFLWRASGDRWFQTSGAPRTERWCGCPNPFCTREEPHEIGIVECRMPKVPEMPGYSFEMTFADPSVPQVTRPEDAPPLSEVYADAIRTIAPDAIHTEAQLARALFVANNFDEIRRRSEQADLTLEHVHTIQRVVTTMLADPAYAKEREAAERLASRTWSARRVGR